MKNIFTDSDMSLTFYTFDLETDTATICKSSSAVLDYVIRETLKKVQKFGFGPTPPPPGSKQNGHNFIIVFHEMVQN